MKVVVGFLMFTCTVFSLAILVQQPQYVQRMEIKKALKERDDAIFYLAHEIEKLKTQLSFDPLLEAPKKK